MRIVPNTHTNHTALVTGANSGLGFEAAAQLAEAVRHSDAWVGFEDPTGTLVATARAISDRAKRSWVYDVMVDPAWRGRGVGRALVEALLDHPAVRRTQASLTTKDAQGVYAPQGFREVVSWGDRTTMARPRPVTPRT